MAKTDEDPKPATEGGGAKPAQAQDATAKAAQGNGGQSAQASGQASAQSKTVQSSAQTKDAIELLKADHRMVESLFAQYQSASPEQKPELIKKICSELVIHTILEEQIFYPACRENGGEAKSLNEAQVEHDSAKMLIAELLDDEQDDPYRDALVKVLSEQIKHHVAEEEAPGRGVFAKARAAQLDLERLGERITARKQELQARAGQLRPSRPVTLQTAVNVIRRQPQEQSMPRRYSSNDRERDEQGRFVSDDDYGRGRYASGGRGRSYDDDDDGRGWHGDTRGHAEAARRGWDERRSFSGRGDDDDDRRGGSRNVGRDEEGRFTSRYGRDDDDDRRGRGHGGWYGDPEGHAEAARRGWDEREGASRGRYRDDDDDYRGGSRSSRGRGDDYGRDHGQGGWFGDSQGHSQAARRGWDERGRERDEDEYRYGGSSRGRSGSYGQPRGR